MKPMLKKMLLVVPLLLTAPLALATITEFASFSDVYPNNNNYIFTNNGNSATFNATNDAVKFKFFAISGLNNSLTGYLAAHLTMTSTTTSSDSSGDANGTGIDSQPMNGTMTLKFTKDAPVNGKNNLLTVVISKSILSGPDGGNVVNISTLSSSIITYTSDFFNASTIHNSSMAFSSSNVDSELLTSTTNSFLESFTAGGSGSFSMTKVVTPLSLQATVLSPVPEPESYAMLLAGLGLIGFMVRRIKTT